MNSLPPAWKTPTRRAEALRELAELSKRLERRDEYLRYAALYRDAVSSPGFVPTGDEKGLGLYYDGEVLLVGGDRQGALTAYEQAAAALEDAMLASDVVFTLAQMEAEQNNPDRAAALAGQSADLRPEGWVFRRTGDFFFGLDRPEEALEYFQRSARAENPDDDSMAYAIMADAYGGRDEPDQFAHYAGLYASTVEAKGEDADDAEKGLAAYYRGRLLAQDGAADAAYARYETASVLLEDTHKRSEVYRLMAQHQAELGDTDAAAASIEKALALLPDEFWLRNHVAGFYADIGRPEDGIRHLELYAAQAETARQTAEANLALAELYRRGENTSMFVHHARLYTEAVVLPEYAATDDEIGNRHFYRGEIATAEQRFDDANLEYELASRSFTDKNRLSETAMRRAEYYAMRENFSEAARWAQLSADHIPEAIWRQVNVAGFFGGLDMEDRAFCLFQRAMATAKTTRDQAQVSWAMANYYRGKADTTRFIHHATDYVNAIWSLGERATTHEKGSSYYFIGEINARQRHPHEAYAAYERASALVKEPYLLSTIYFTMARYHLKYGDHAMANRLALAGAGLLPNKRWVVAEAMGILADLQDFAAAEEIAMLAMYLDPENQGLYQTLAYMYFDKVGDRRTASHYHKKYIDYLYDRNDRGPQPVSKSWREELWYARGGQNGIDRTWGLESYYTLNRWSSGDYWSGMSHQLYRNYYLKNGWFGKVYMQYGGTFDSQFTSYHWINEFERHTNVSRSHLEETGYLIFGATLHPFPRKWLNGFELWAEYHMGLGRNVDNDFRIGTKYTLVEGEWLRPSGNLWHYYKSETNLWYSWEDKVGNLYGELRQGMAYVNDCDRNLLFIPYGLLTYNYDGMNKEHHFGSDAGIALMIKKYFREDRYHNPRSTIDLTVSYRWPLTRGRDPVLGISASTNF
ncbi:MAG: hypothetical protein LUE17_06175 [Planctomycetaceae bacterium]|nr:hypothetical protein [Planctomycetaceae bacterium]